MKKIIPLLLVTILLTGCATKEVNIEQSVPAQTRERVCEDVKIQIDNIQILGKSGSDSSQALGGVIGAEVGLLGCLGGPIGCLVGAAIGGISGVGLGTLYKSADYEVDTIEGKFICHEKSCEDITGKSFKTDGQYIIKGRTCYYK